MLKTYRVFSASVVASLFLLQCLAGAFATSSRADQPLSGNYDDYDIPKYEGLYQQALENLERAKSVLEDRTKEAAVARDFLVQEEKELEVITSRIRDEERKIEVSRTEIATLNAAITKDDAELTKNRQELPVLEKQVKEKQQQLAALDSQVGPAQENAKKLEEKADLEEKKVADLKASVDQAKARVTELTTRETEAKANLAAQEKKVADLEAAVAADQTAIAELEKRITDLGGKITQLETDIPVLEKKYLDQDAKATEAEKKADAAEAAGSANAAALRKKAKDERAKANQYKSDWEKAVKDLADSKTKLDKAIVALDSKRDDLKDRETKLADAKQGVPALKQVVTDVQAKLLVAKKDLAQSQQALTAAEPAASEARAKAEEAKKNAITLAKMAEDLRKEIAGRNARIVELKDRNVVLADRILKARGQIDLENKQIVDANTKLKTLRPQETAARDQVQKARERSERADTLRDQARGQADQAAILRDRSLARLELVRENMRRYVEIANRDGNREGADDGRREGNRQGILLGRRDGENNGARDGKEQGIRDGRERVRAQARADGRRDGEKNGNVVGGRDGNAQGIIEGSRDGEREGNQAGYQAGYQLGLNTGYQEGAAAGHAMGGYTIGYKEGYSAGQVRAVSEANSVGEPEGYREAEQLFLNADLEDLSVANHPAAKSDVFTHPQWENYTPQPPTYPHPRIREAYLAAYDGAFREEAGRAFDAAYDVAYRDWYRSAYDAQYTIWLNKDYPEEYKPAYDVAYRTAYDQVYSIAFERSRKEVYPSAYKQAYDEAYPKRYEVGKKDGRKDGYEKGKREAYEADLNQGRISGDAAGYKDAYGPALQAARKRGYDRAVAFYSTNAVLSIDGMVAMDSNEDAVFAPGERVSAAVAVENHGKAASASKELLATITGATSGLEVELASDPIVSVKGQSRTVVTRVGRVKIKTNAEVGKVERYTLTVTQAGKVLSRQDLSVRVAYPFQVVEASPVDSVTSDSINRLAVRVRNASAKASEANVAARLTSTDGLSQVVVGSADLKKVGAGEERAFELTFTIAPESEFQKLGFALEILDGNKLVGRSDFKVDSTHTWNYSASSAGLLLITDSSVGKALDRAARRAGIQYDWWDIRSAGSLTSEVLGQYSGQTLVIPTVTAALDIETANAVRDFLAAGGKVLAGLGNQSSGPVAKVLEKAASAFTGESIQGDLTLFERNTFETDPRIPAYLLAETGNLAILATEVAAGKLLAFRYLALDFESKVQSYLALGVQNEGGLAELERTYAFEAVIRDLTKEMRDDAEVGGKHYSKSQRGALKLTSYVNRALVEEADSVSTNVLTAAYPVLEAARKDTKGFFRRLKIKKVLKPLKKLLND